MYKNFDAGFQGGSDNTEGHSSQIVQADGQDAINLPDSSYIRDADMMRDGMDLILDGPDGQLVVEGYFAGTDAPMLTADDGSSLSPDLVNSFVKSAPQYAQNMSVTDESPVGTVQEVSGEATVTHADGSTETAHIGTLIFQGDVIETGHDGAVNIAFSDESSFAVSEDARLAIDDYNFDPATESGAQDFSMLKGMFVFTSGLIGRDDPDDVNIDTPVGSIGIRGTIIAGDVDAGEITVVEGAIVLRDFDGNEMTLASQFETGTFKPGQGIEHNGQRSAHDVADKFQGVSRVSPSLFSSINDAAAESIDAQGVNDGVEVEEMLDEAPADDQANPDGSVDENADNQVDGTVDNAAVAEDGAVDQAVQNVDNHADKPMQASLDPAKATLDPAAKALHVPKPAGSSAQAKAHVQPVHNNQDTNNDDDGGALNTQTTDTTTAPPPPLPAGPTGPTVIEMGTLNVNGSGFLEAHQGGVTYQGTAGVDNFTNNEVAAHSTSGSQMFHQNLSIFTGAGNDTVDLYQDAGFSLRMGKINTGLGNDTIKLNLYPGTTAIEEINGGGGIDVLEINNAVTNLDFSNIEKLRGIEEIRLDNGGNMQTITLTSDMVLQNAATSELITSTADNVFFTTALKTLKIQATRRIQSISI